MIFQIFLMLFALFAISKTVRQYKKKKVSRHWFLVWTGLWVVVIGVALAPQTTDVVARYVGVEKGADLLVYCAIVLLFYVMYRMFVRMERQHQELTQLVRKIAVLDAKKQQKP